MVSDTLISPKLYDRLVMSIKSIDEAQIDTASRS